MIEFAFCVVHNMFHFLFLNFFFFPIF